jgi:signal transduction histidine kinase/FixJ family two-component response regulator
MPGGANGQGPIARAQRRACQVSRVFGWIVVGIGLLVFVGWLLDRPLLRYFFPGYPTLKLNAGLAFIFCGIPLAWAPEGGVWHARVRKVCAAAVIAIGALTLIEYAANVSFAPLIATLNFLLLGVAIWLLDSRTAHGGWPAQVLALTVASIAYVMLLGLAYDVTTPYREHVTGGVALHGMLLFLFLSIAVLCARPDRGVMGLVLSPAASGLLIRRLLPAAILIPPALGWLRLQGEAAGLFGEHIGVALHVATNVAIFTILIWSTANAVGRSEVDRLAAERRVLGQLSRLDLLNHITRAIGERLDVHSVYQVVVRSLEDNLPIDFGCIASYDPGAGLLTVECVGSRSEALALTLALPERARLPIDQNGLARCVGGSLVYERDISESAFPFTSRLAQGGLNSLVIAPLRSESSVFGVLVAARRPADAFSSAECEFLLQLSEHVALAARQTQLYEALQAAYDDLRQSQESVLQQERLRSLGQMASGIAHDINNALSPAALYTEALLERETGLTPKGREQLTIIYRAIDDVAGTVARMREFYRQREPQVQLEMVDLNRLVAQVADLTRARWRDLPLERGTVIDLRSELDPVLPPVMGAATEIRDALTNLIFNAVDAMPAGGLLTVRTRGVRGSTHVCVEVIDTGTGMDDETRRRCLEPFYTTKGERGTGLGLPMVYGMVQRHSAELEIESTPGSGTTVRLILSTAVEESASIQAPPTLANGAPLRILLIDDDPLLIRSLRDTLEADGHIVATADGGQAGVHAFVTAQRQGEPFSAVITDLGMPYFDGRRVAAAIRTAATHVPIILLTGWGERLISENDVPPDVDRVLAKPPKLQLLRVVLAELATRAVASEPSPRESAANAPSAIKIR